MSNPSAFSKPLAHPPYALIDEDEWALYQKWMGKKSDEEGIAFFRRARSRTDHSQLNFKVYNQYRQEFAEEEAKRRTLEVMDGLYDEIMNAHDVVKEMEKKNAQ